MPKGDHVQNKFYGGETSETAHGRTEISKYPESLSEMFNTFPHKHGAASNRAGLGFVAPCSTDTGVVRTHAFQYNTNDTYTLEFTAGKIRFMRHDGTSAGFILEVDSSGDPLVTISGIVPATNVVTSSTHGFAVDDYVYWVDTTGVAWYYFIAAIPSATTFTLKDRDGTLVDLTTTLSGETVRRIYTVPTPYADGDLVSLDIKQKNDVMTICHHDYHPQELRRSKHSSWTLTKTVLEPVMTKPTNLRVHPSSYNDAYFYRYNSIDDRIVNITAIAAGSTTKLTFAITQDDAPTYSAIGPVSGMPEDNLEEGRVFCISGAEWLTGGTADDRLDIAAKINGPNRVLKNRVKESGDGIYTFDLYNLAGVAIDTSAWTGPSYTTRSAHYGAMRLLYRVTAVSVDGEESFPTVDIDPAAADVLDFEWPASVSWAAPAGVNVDHYAVYKESNSVWGFIGTAEDPYFNDRNFAPELGDNPPEEPIRNPFQKAITGASHASHCVITCVAHGYKAGERVLIDGGDMDELGTAATPIAHYVSTDGLTDDSFKIENVNGVAINTSTGYTVWTAGGYAQDFPSGSVYFKQRRAFVSRYNQRQTIEMSAINLHSTFTRSSDAFGFRIEEQSANDIRHSMAGADLLFFTSGGIILSTSGESGYTLGNVNNIEQMAAGIAENVPPLKMRTSSIYVQDKHSQVFDLAYAFEQDKYLGQDLTILAPHFIDGVTIDSWAYQPVPEPIVWCIMSNGRFLSLLYERDNNIFGWSEHETTGGRGTVERVTVTPEGADMNAYFVVRRTIDDNVRKTHEVIWNRRFDNVRDCRFLDSYVMLDNPVTVSNMVEESGASVGIKVTATGHGFTENDIIEMDAVVGATEVNLNKYRVAESVPPSSSGGSFYLVKQDISDKANITGIEASGDHVLVTHDATLDINTGDVVFVEGWAATSASLLNNLWHYAERVSDTTFKLGTPGNHLYLNAAGISSGHGPWIGLAAPTVPPTTVATIRKGTLEDKAAVSAYISGGEVRKCVTTVSGLNHLEGETVTALADGNVVSDLEVDSGAVTIPDASGRVCVGLPYQSRFESLPLDSPESNFLGKVRSIEKLEMLLYRTRGLKAGPDSDTLTEMKQRSDEGWNEVSELNTGEETIDFLPSEANRGKYTVVQDYPLPMTVQAAGIHFSVGSGVSARQRRGRL